MLLYGCTGYETCCCMGVLGMRHAVVWVYWVWDVLLYGCTGYETCCCMGVLGMGHAVVWVYWV